MLNRDPRFYIDIIYNQCTDSRLWTQLKFTMKIVAGVTVYSELLNQDYMQGITIHRLL